MFFFFKGGLVALTFFFFLSLSLIVQAERDGFYYDIRLIDALNQAGLVNYALLHIDLMLERYPDRSDQIYYAKARFHFSRNRQGQARAALGKITETSPYFTESLLLNAEQAIQRGDLQSAAEVYEQYFSKVDQPAGAQPADAAVFREAVLYYAQTKIAAGEGRKAADILKLLSNLSEAEAPSSDGLLLSIAEAIMSSMENRLEMDQRIDRDLIREQIADLLEVQWRHGGLSRLTVQAFIQAARGYLLLAQPEKALEQLQAVGRTAARLEQQQPKESSPVPVAFYYYARAYEQIGRNNLREGNRQEAERALLIAATFYNRRLLQNYSDHAYADRAMVRYAQLEVLVEDNLTGSLPPLSVGVAGGFPLKVEEADRLYQAGHYERAIPLYLQAIRMARGNRNIPILVQRLINAYNNTDRFLEGAAVASYVADFFPDNEGTAKAMLLAGRAFMRRAQETENQQEQELLAGNAINIWNKFIEVQPGHDNAPSIAFFIAEYKYSRALALVEQSRKIEVREEQQRLAEAARDAFEKCIPHYQRMLDQYPETPEGVRSLYKLAWVYYNLEQGVKAAELFSRYSVLEVSSTYSDDRLRARLHAGEQLMFSETPEKAIAELQQLLKWYQRSPANLNTQSETAGKIQEDAANYLAWAYDMTAETIRPRLQEIDKEGERLQQDIGEMKNRLREIELIVAQAEERKRLAEDKTEKINNRMSAYLSHPEEMALAEMMPSEQEMRGASEDERRLMEETVRRGSRELAESYRAREIESRQGQIGDLAEQIQNRLKEIATIAVEISLGEVTAEEKEILEQKKCTFENYIEAEKAVVKVLEMELAALRENHNRRDQLLAERDYNDARQAVKEKYEVLEKNIEAKVDLQITKAENEEKGLLDQVSGLKEKIARSREEREPVFTLLEKKKLEAVERFQQFIQEYPQSVYVPEHLARIGTIHLEIGEYAKAVEYLNQLSGQYPRHEATMKAYFDLGRALFETGRQEEAMKTFSRKAEYFAEQRANNLEYIARSALTAEEPALALAAYEELLTRSEDPEHPDYPHLYGEQGRYQEHLLSQATEAALQAEKFGQARRLGERLLESNPNTAYFFRIQINIARAARAAEPPDFARAERALGQVARLAQDEYLKNEALIEYGKTSMLNKARGADALRRALGQFRQLVMMDGQELLILADFDDPEVQPFIEEAIYRSALCHALLGNRDQRDFLVLEYRRLFADGRYLARINDLPAPGY